ncbi:MAG: alpha/beta hydrolase family protein, partial [bacterium]
EEVRVKLNLHKRVTADFPPTFLWHGGEDDSVPPENSLLLANALRKAGVPFELHLFQQGAHGISTCTVEVETPDARCKAWVPLAKSWLNTLFQYEP